MFFTEVYDNDVPFIFANFNGTQGDVEVVTHEAGHAFADWINRDRVPMEYIWPSMEGCEVHSMSMEFFAEPWAGSASTISIPARFTISTTALRRLFRSGSGL